MEHQRIRVGDLVFEREQMDDSVVQNKLLTFRNTHTRALCMCRSEGVEMYVGLRGGMCYLARLPGSASRHQPSCPSFDVVDDGDEDRQICHPDFPLQRVLPSFDLNTKSEPAVAASRSSAAVEKISLRALLLQLWRNAGLHRWYPAMHGRRHWNLVRYLLQKEAQSVLLGNVPLESRLLLPEVFRLSDEDAHRRQNIGFLDSLLSSRQTHSSRPLALLVGPIRSFQASKFGTRLQIRHLPETVFYLDESLSQSITHQYLFEITGIGRESKDEVMAILLVDKTSHGNYVAADCALMRISPEWLPLFSHAEKDLVANLVSSGRSFLLSALLPPHTSPIAYLTDLGEHVRPLFAGDSSFAA